MKLTAHEEYGLRCLLQIGRQGERGSLTIPQLSRLEGISEAYAAKLLRILRLGGYVKSTRGPVGGYTLARPAEEIVIGEVLALFGGKLIEEDFCRTHSGMYDICTHTSACTLRPLWQAIQTAIDRVLFRITLKDLLEQGAVCREPAATRNDEGLVELNKTDGEAISKAEPVLPKPQT